MKKYLLAAIIPLGLITSLPTQAATASGDGCGINAPSTYTTALEQGGIIYTLIGNKTCVISGLTDKAMMATIVNILTESQATGRNVYLGIGTGGTVLVSLQY